MPTLKTPILDGLDDELAHLANSSLSIDGSHFAGLPNRLIRVDELRSILLHPSSSFNARDRVLNHLGEQGSSDKRWKSVLLAMVTPALRQVVTSLSRTCDPGIVDLEAEVVAGAMAKAALVSAASTHVASSIRWAGYRAGLSAVVAADEVGRTSSIDYKGSPPSLPWGHPDFVLRRAVVAGVITKAESELIGSTRLGDLSITDAAQLNDSSYQVTQRRRHRAEVRLVEWLATQ